MKVLITTRQIVEVYTVNDEFEANDSPEVNLEDFRESYINHVLDAQDVNADTSDEKFRMVPKELDTLTIEPVPEGE